ncbi:MAG: hypothetical protein KDD37_04060 [Bdellovibrionales bacterium]|nr:hypothetical protein [Bdellovibrionales bacterium]
MKQFFFILTTTLFFGNAYASVSKDNIQPDAAYCSPKSEAVPQTELQKIIRENCNTKQPFNLSWVSSKTVTFCCTLK